MILTGTLLAVAAAGAEITFEPLLPRPEDPVTVTVTYDTACFLESEMEVDGRTIRVVAVEGCICPERLPSPLTFEVTLDPLPLGIYDVELWLERREPDLDCGPPELLDSTRLVVQTVSSHLSFSLAPPQPTSEDEILLKIDSFCPSSFVDLRVVGDLVFIDEATSPVAAPCGPVWESELPIGRLEAGRYTLLNLFLDGVALPMPPPILDTTPTLNTVDTFEVLPADGVGDGGEGMRELYFDAGRFVVTAMFTTEVGFGFGTAVRLTDRSGYFWFFQQDNVELTVKLLDGCAINARLWLFAAGMTDVGIDLRVEDRWTGEERRYRNPVGMPFETIRDVEAFAGCSLP